MLQPLIDCNQQILTQIEHTSQLLDTKLMQKEAGQSISWEETQYLVMSLVCRLEAVVDSE